MWERSMDPLFYNAITIGSWAIVIILLLILIRVANVFRYIPNNQVGIVEKTWAPKGSITAGFIALHGEAGFEPEILRGGIHVFWPFTYRIHKSDLVTVGPDRLRVRARRHAARALAGARRQRHRRQIGFPGRAPLSHRGGQKGPQRKV